jgi:colanic acid/amylovoran biosynthesis glycosyltransferase
MNLAIISPNNNAYSETFIQAHKRIPGVNIYYYYGGGIPNFLEGHGDVASKTLWAKTSRNLKHRLKKTGLSLSEEALVDSFKKHRINCVLAEYGLTAVNVLNVCRKIDLPLIAHFHGYDASTHLAIEEYGEAYKEMFSYARSIIAVSRVMEKKLLSLGCPASKLVYNTYGPDDEFLNLVPSYGKKQFIGIGRFVDKKAPYYTLLAFQKTLKKHPDARLIIGGNGPLLNTCNNLVKYLKIENNVSFPGIITPDQYRVYLNESIAFVQHSITAENGDMEGTPVGVLEASAAGLPVISTIHAGIPDVIIHDKTGLLCLEHDVDQMAIHMLQILDDKQFAINMGAAGKENIRKNFSMERHLNLLAEVIETCK